MAPPRSLPALLLLLALPGTTAADWSLTAAAAPFTWTGTGAAVQQLPYPLHLGERLRTGAGGRLRVQGPQGLIVTLGEVAALGFESEQGTARLVLDQGLMQIETAVPLRLSVVLGGEARPLELGAHSRVWLEQGPSGRSTCLLQGSLQMASAEKDALLPGSCDYRSPQGRPLRVRPSPEALRLREAQLSLPESR
jgi:ferric-dicitrate binding protein FerR (iron transport regulator)